MGHVLSITNLGCSKGQLISKGLFGVFNSSKKQQQMKTSRPQIWGIILSTVGWIFSFIFWKNSGYQQVLSKLTDL